MVKDLCFEIIEACPNNCKFCSSNSCIDKKKIINLSDFKRVIDYFLSTGGIEELSLSGGEPFLHHDIFEMVSYAKSHNIRTIIFTSGVIRNKPLSLEEKQLLEEKMNKDLMEIETHEPWNDRLKNNVKKYYERFLNLPEFKCLDKEELTILKSLGLDKIVFDFQAYNQETDAYLMGREPYMHNCLSDSVINASRVGLETDIHFIPMKPNYKEIGDILELLEIAKINNISLLNFVPQGRGLNNKEELLLTETDLEEFMNIISKNKDCYQGNIRIGIPLLNDATHKCNAGLEKLDIKFDGTILPCPAFKELDPETMHKYGIKTYNIYENLTEVKTPGGKRLVPLCHSVYNMNRN